MGGDGNLAVGPKTFIYPHLSSSSFSLPVSLSTMALCLNNLLLSHNFLESCEIVQLLTLIFNLHICLPFNTCYYYPLIFYKSIFYLITYYFLLLLYTFPILHYYKKRKKLVLLPYTYNVLEVLPLFLFFFFFFF